MRYLAVGFLRLAAGMTSYPPAPPSIWNLRAGTHLRAGLSHTTVLPDFDFETYSEAGFLWLPTLGKWGALPNASQGKKGLSIVGSQVYAEHPSTEIISLYYDLKDGRGRRPWRPGMPPPLDLIAHIEAGGLLEAWNSGFEYRIWNLVGRRAYGWPALPLHQLRCAMAKSRAHALPGGLGPAGEVLRLQYPKDPDGDRLIKKFSMPRNPTKSDKRLRILMDEDEVDGPRMAQYNERDIVTEAEASSRTPDLDATELQYWLMDQEINMRGVQMDRDSIGHCIAIVEQAHTQYNAELRALTRGAVAYASEVAKLQTWLATTQGVFLTDLTEDTIDAALEDAAMSELARRALGIRQLIGSAAVKKLFAMSNCLSAAGRMHDLFTYGGAHTMRTTGNGAQPTNLPKGGPDMVRCFRMVAGGSAQARKATGWTEDLMLQHGHAVGCRRHHSPSHNNCPWCGAAKGGETQEWSWRAAADALEVIALRDLATVEWYFGDAVATVSGCLRGLFIAAEGYDLICSDYSAIEAVVAAMIAGVQWRIDVFRTHGKIYEASAAMMAKISVEEVLNYKKTHGSHHPLRDKGKRAELACGYGGWVGAWIAFGADKYMTEEEMKQATLEWRAASPEIPEFWGGQWRRLPGGGWRQETFGIEGAFVRAVLSPGQVQEYRGFKCLVHEDVLYLTLLSGRHMKYHRPRLAATEKYGRAQWDITYEGWNTNPKNGPTGWIRRNTYGGRLFENIVQATARDIQWHGMLALRAAGYPIVLHVYDEDIAEVPEGWGSIEELECIMSAMPPWAADWPVRATGGWRGKRYRKD